MRRFVSSLFRRHVSTNQSPKTIHLTLSVNDPEIVSILSKYPSGEERDRFATEALRVGAIALSRPALESELNRTFQRYFDAENGELNRWIGNHERSELTRAMNLLINNLI